MDGHIYIYIHIYTHTHTRPNAPELSSLVASSTMRRLGERFLLGPPGYTDRNRIEETGQSTSPPILPPAPIQHQAKKRHTLGRGRRRRHAAAATVRHGRRAVDLVAVVAKAGAKAGGRSVSRSPHHIGSFRTPLTSPTQTRVPTNTTHTHARTSRQPLLLAPAAACLVPCCVCGGA